MAINKERGAVTHYTEGTVSLCVYFPNDEVCCQNCKFCYGEDRGGLRRCRCRLLDDAIIPNDYVPFAILPDCPIHFEKEET